MTSTLVDTNVLIDVLGNGQDRAWSVACLKSAFEESEIVINAVIWSELASPGLCEAELSRTLGWLKVKREPIPFEAAFKAGLAHQRYRQSGGQRERTLPDFLIGAHAEAKGYRLATRDASRYRSYFPDLEIIAPGTYP